MHPSPIFHCDDKDGALAFMAENPFAVLAVNGDTGPVSALVPLVAVPNGKGLLGHVARANPFWKAAVKSEKTIAIFQSSDAYISPSSYASKKEHGRAVPTWNYMALEVRGCIEIQTDASKMAPYLEPLIHKMESHRESPWQMSDAPSEYISKLSRAIVGLHLEIDHITYVRKLDQNKSKEDRAGVIESLEKTGDANAIALASEMKK